MQVIKESFTHHATHLQCFSRTRSHFFLLPTPAFPQQHLLMLRRQHPHHGPPSDSGRDLQSFHDWSVLIILSYVLISNIRTKAREILVNLSLMDFMCAAANFTGVCINFYQYLGNSDVRRAHGSMNRVCLAQAFFAMYGTISSELWTMCIAVYIFILIMFQEKKTVNRSMPAFYVVSYGLPLLCTAWFIATKKLGYDRLSGSGWCSVILYQHGQYKPLTAVFANDLWIYLTVLLVSVIFFSLHCYLKHEVGILCLAT